MTGLLDLKSSEIGRFFAWFSWYARPRPMLFFISGIKLPVSLIFSSEFSVVGLRRTCLKKDMS